MVDIVTGGAGFIGSHLVDSLLSQGRKVCVFDIKSETPNLTQHAENPDFAYYRIDIGREYFDDLFEKIQPEHVYHLAALADIIPSIKEPELYFRTNVTGTLKVLQAARHVQAKRFIYAASSSCYGEFPRFPTSESQPEQPQYPYALTKYLGEQLVTHWMNVYQIPAVSLRLFNAYGRRARSNGAYGAMFGTFLAQKKNGLPLTVVGDGTQERDFIHVSDVVDAFIRAAQSEYCGVYNVGTGSPESINYIAKLIGGSVVHIPKRPGEPIITCADISKIKQHFGWEPKKDIESGVKELLDHLDDYAGAPLWTPEKIASATKEWFMHLGASSHE